MKLLNIENQKNKDALAKTEQSLQSEKKIVENKTSEIADLMQQIDMLRNNSSASSGQMLDKIKALEEAKTDLTAKLKNALAELKKERESNE